MSVLPPSSSQATGQQLLQIMAAAIGNGGTELTQPWTTGTKAPNPSQVSAACEAAVQLLLKPEQLSKELCEVREKVRQREVRGPSGVLRSSKALASKGHGKGLASRGHGKGLASRDHSKRERERNCYTARRV